MVLGMSIDDTPVEYLQDLGRIRTFFESTNFYDVSPRDDLAFSSTDYVLAKPGSHYIAYPPDATSTLGIRSMTSGVYNLTWLDTINGTVVEQKNVSIPSGDRIFTKPSGFSSEIALYINRIEQTTITPVPDVVVPGATWQTKLPSEVDLNDTILNQFIANIGGRGVIIKDGYMVKSWGTQTTKADWASAVKPVMSTLLFFAVHEGKIPSVDERIRNYGWALNTKDQTITLRHLANMVSGYARGESPGNAWAYNDYAINLYAKTLFDGVFQTIADNTARSPNRLGVLQFQDGTLFSSRGGYGVSTTPRDFARIGWFWLNKGNWNGSQVLPKSFFDTYMKSHVAGNIPRSTTETSDYLGVGTLGGGSDQTEYGPGIYGFNWWFNAPVGTTRAHSPGLMHLQIHFKQMDTGELK